MQEVDIQNSATVNANASTVFINGSLEPRLRCVAVESSVGPVPGKAILMLGSITKTERAPRTLLAYSDYERWKYGARVIVKSDGDICFLGTLLQRQDQGNTDAPIWVALDDRWLMSRCPVRGALVYDEGEGIRWCSRFLPAFNPNGFWNCVGADAGGQWGIIPTFSPYAESRPTDKTESFGDLVIGEVTAWTPRRVLDYLNYALCQECNHDGWVPQRQRRTLYQSDRIKWPWGVTLDGTGGKGGLDPLDAKMQSMDCSGRNLLESVCQTLRFAGTHDLGLDLDGETSRVTFYSRVGQRDGAEIRVRRGGQISEHSVAVDFDLHEDASGVAEAILVEGSPRKLETRVEFNPDKDPRTNEEAKPEDNTNTLKIAWSQDHDNWFRQVIWGGDSEEEEAATYALTPSAPDVAPDQRCDGNDGRPLIYSCSNEAISLARQLYPDVGMCFQIDTDKMDTEEETSPFSGFAGEGEEKPFVSRFLYPVLRNTRPTYSEQLSKLSVNGTQLEDGIPVRVEIRNGTNWGDAPFLNGWLSGPTKIKVNGLCENAEGEVHCIYSGSLLNAPWSVAWKGLRINLAVPLDHRVEGYAEIDEQSELDGSLVEEFGGRILDAELNPAFTHEYRMNSWPRPNTAAAEDGDLENSTGDAERAAKRLLQRKKRPEKRSSWVFAGIRLDYTAGRWVKRIRVIGGSSADIDYGIEAPIQSVTYDFLRQETRVGGLLHYLPTPRVDEQEQTEGGEKED